MTAVLYNDFIEYKVELPLEDCPKILFFRGRYYHHFATDYMPVVHFYSAEKLYRIPKRIAQKAKRIDK